MKTQISGFLQGVAGAISGLIPSKSRGNKTASHKTGSSQKRLVKRSLGKKKQSKKGRARSRKNGERHSRRTPESIVAKVPIANSGTSKVTRKVAIYSCPGCGLQAQESLMAEHFQGSPSHQYSLPLERTKDQKIEEEPRGELRDDDSRDSVRNLLQILLPPRPFGRRHFQKKTSSDSNSVKTPGSESARS